MAFSPDGRDSPPRAATGTVKVWDAATGRTSSPSRGTPTPVMSVAFSPDGRRLASASEDGTVKVWDAATGQEALTLKGHTGAVTSVAFSPDGRRLASASDDGTVKVWDAATGQEALTLTGHTGAVTSVAFSPDGTPPRLRQRRRDGEGLGRGDRPGGPHPQGAHRARSRAWRSAPTARRLASAGADRTVKVWDAATGQEALTLSGHTDAVHERGVQPRRPPPRLRRLRTGR